MEGTGVGAWLKLVYEKTQGGASFRLGEERSLYYELNGCKFVDIKIGDTVLEACFITTLRREHKKQGEGDKDFYWEEVAVLYSDGSEFELCGDGFYLRANYDAHNNRAKLEREYEFRRELKKLLAEKDEIERKIEELTSPR